MIRISGVLVVGPDVVGEAVAVWDVEPLDVVAAEVAASVDVELDERASVAGAPLDGVVEPGAGGVSRDQLDLEVVSADRAPSAAPLVGSPC